jgi:hypothetical protein
MARFYKPNAWYGTKARCGWRPCNKPLPKGRTRRREFCSDSCRQMAYIHRKTNKLALIRAFHADMRDVIRRGQIERQVDRQIAQVLLKDYEANS